MAGSYVDTNYLHLCYPFIIEDIFETFIELIYEIILKEEYQISWRIIPMNAHGVLICLQNMQAVSPYWFPAHLEVSTLTVQYFRRNKNGLLYSV